MTWLVYSLSADFATSNNAAQQPTGLKFTPGAEKRYWIRFNGIVRSSVNNAAPWIGFNWPGGGVSYSVGWMRIPQATTLEPSVRFWGPASPTATAGTTFTHVSAATSWYVDGNCVLQTGAARSGDFEVSLRVENAVAATVTLKAGSRLWVWEY